jgi:hypothetical protein
MGLIPEVCFVNMIKVEPGFIDHTAFEKILMDFHYRGILA